MSEPLVIGIGNPDRGDDAVGPLIASRLIGCPCARVIVRNDDALALLEDWADAEAVILIDAAAANGLPGRIHRLQLAPQAADDRVLGKLTLPSTHAFGLAEAVALARALARLPGHLIVYAVEGQLFSAGAPVTSAVLAAVDATVDLIRQEIKQLSGPAIGTDGAGSKGVQG